MLPLLAPAISITLYSDAPVLATTLTAGRRKSNERSVAEDLCVSVSLLTEQVVRGGVQRLTSGFRVAGTQLVYQPRWQQSFVYGYSLLVGAFAMAISKIRYAGTDRGGGGLSLSSSFRLVRTPFKHETNMVKTTAVRQTVGP